MKRIIATSLAFGLTTLGATAALAQEGPWYVEAGITYSDLSEEAQSIANAPFPGATLINESELDGGWGGRLAIGRAFGDFRVEMEVARTETDSETFSIRSPIQATLAQDGRRDISRYMVNGYWDALSADAPVRPFVGVGLGLADVSVYRFAGTAIAPDTRYIHLDDSDSGLAWQAMAGAALSVAPRVRLTVQYRYLDTGDYEIDDSRGEAVRSSLTSHNFDVGVRFAF